jgi:hypothetical protein
MIMSVFQKRVSTSFLPPTKSILAAIILLPATPLTVTPMSQTPRLFGAPWFITDGHVDVPDIENVSRPVTEVPSTGYAVALLCLENVIDASLVTDCHVDVPDNETAFETSDEGI